MLFKAVTSHHRRLQRSSQSGHATHERREANDEYSPDSQEWRKRAGNNCYRFLRVLISKRHCYCIYLRNKSFIWDHCIFVSGVSVTPCHNKCFNFNFVRFRRYASTLPEESWSSLTWSIRYNSQQNFINLKSLKTFIERSSNNRKSHFNKRRICFLSQFYSELFWSKITKLGYSCK